MRIVCISDTHNQHNKLTIPECDVLVHAGDITYKGEINVLRNFNKWLKKQPATHKVIIPGNHDLTFESDERAALRAFWRSNNNNIHILNQSSVVIDGVKFYGDPRTPWFHDWAFNVPRGEALNRVWSKIPEDTDVLVTHGPPMGYGDWSPYSLEHAGDPWLLQHIERVAPAYHICGHFHGGYGVRRINDYTVAINAASCNDRYEITNEPIAVIMEKI